MSLAKPSDSAKQYYHITADSASYLNKSDTYILRNGVIKRKDLSISANSIIVNKTTNILKATGNVLILDGTNKIWAKRLIFNLKTKKGIIDNAIFFVKKDHIFLRAKHSYKISSNSYILDKPSLTGCGDPKKPFNNCPDWHISGSSSKIVKGEYVRTTNALFSAGSIPILYTPYMSHSLDKKRKTGFLFPELEYSSHNGLVYNQPFFLVLGRSMDMTFTLKEKSKIGLGVDIEHRYAASDNIRGKSFISYLHKKKKSAKKNLLNISSSNSYNFNNGRIFAEYNHIFGREDYYNLNNKNIDFYASRFVESQLIANYNYKNWSFGLDNKLYEDLDSANDRKTLQTIPALTINKHSTIISGTPLYLSVNSGFTNFYRVKGNKGIVLDAAPVVSIPYNASVFHLSSAIKSDQTFYKNNESGNKFSHLRIVPQFTQTISTDLVKQYYGNKFNLLHLITPSISYNFIPTISQSHLPDFVSKIDSKSQIVFQIKQRLMSKSNGKSHQLAYLNISQPYDINRLSRHKKPLEPIFVDMQLNISKISYDLTLHYDHYKHQFVDLSSDISYVGMLTAKIGYELAKNANFEKQSEQINAKLALSVSKTFSISTTNDYDIMNRFFSNNQFDLVVKESCWGIDLSMFTREIPATLANSNRTKDSGFILSITLRGLGNFAYKG